MLKQTTDYYEEFITSCIFYLSFFLTGGDLSNELVRHFLIECTQKGVRLKGCPNEPYFGEYQSFALQLVNNRDPYWLFGYTAHSERLHTPYCPLLVFGALYHWLLVDNFVFSIT